jgi:hypothetical protein
MADLAMLAMHVRADGSAINPHSGALSLQEPGKRA